MPKTLHEMLQISEYESISTEQIAEMERSAMVAHLTEIDETNGDTYLHIALKNKPHPALFLILLKVLSEKQLLNKICHTRNQAGVTPWQLAYKNQLGTYANYIAEHLANDVDFANWISHFANENIDTAAGKMPRFPAVINSSAKAQFNMLIKALGSLAAKHIAEPNSEGRTPLHLAALHGDGAMVHTLLKTLDKQAAKVAAMKDQRHQTAWMLSMQNLEHGEDIALVFIAWGILKPANEDMMTPLHGATNNSDTAKVLSQLAILDDKAVNVLTMVDSDGMTPLHYATTYGNVIMVQAILDALGHQAATVATKRDKYNCTPLHSAAEHGDTAMVLAILRASGRLAATVAAIKGHDDWTALHLAVCHGDATMVRAVLLALGEHAATAAAIANKQGLTPLMLIKQNENHADEITAVFIERGLLKPQFNLLSNLKTLGNKLIKTAPVLPKSQPDNKINDDNNHPTTIQKKRSS